MTQKLSPHKISKMMALYFEGYSQSEIANKLKVDQSTVSLYVSKFKFLAEQQGIEAAGKEFDIMDQVEALHSLAAELKKSKLTVEEAKIGLKMEQLFRKLGIKQEDYKDLIQACTKMKSEGFINDAVKLNKLESSTGMTHGELLEQYASTHKKLEKEEQVLQMTASKLSAAKQELANIDKQKKAASQSLKAHMDQIGVDTHRLKLVESLAQVLKEAGILDKDLKEYIAQQQVLGKAGISLDVFTAIVEKAKVLTSQDQGKELLQMLSDYGNLIETLKALQAKVQTLNKEADGLAQQAKLKGKIEGDIAKLKAEKAGLEGYVAQLYDQKNALDNIKSEANSLSEKKATLEHEIAEQEGYLTLLTDDIEIKEQKVSDLKELESKRDAMLNSISAIKAELDQDRVRLDIFESFLGFIESSSLAELEKFVKVLPSLLSEVKGGKYSPELMRGMILEQLGVDKLQLLKCGHCRARFAVDKLPKLSGYQCPICGLSHTVEVDEDATAILKTALSAPKPPQITVMQTVTSVAKQPKPQNDSGA